MSKFIIATSVAMLSYFAVISSICFNVVPVITTSPH